MKNISADQVNELRQGNEKAFEAIFHRYWEQLFAAAHKRLQDEQQAQDIVQDVLIQLWNSRASLNLQPEYLEYYLLKAVKNRVINYYHSEKVKERILQEQRDRFEAISQNDISLPAYQQLEEFLHTQIEALPVTMRSVYKLKDKEYTVQEIACNLNLAEQTVRNNITEAQHRLRKAIKAKFRTEYSLLIFLFVLLTKL
ncbi:sigma-70 family RNA polymerase sigma factor [Mucilaginibacter sp.]|uniref:RNA polymerase sigma factor n=1 Tax=Mucilaginibacter sp. TaxID=1882438 RepID=UPI0026260CDA|nr:sigma-70 family RNA polymerase sigma factor [Mucilaginibacter sp.]MDB4924225.1 sigma-70 family polymerase sigma factor [Mucilaginibacter sp.]